jgi:hypothetical protein
MNMRIANSCFVLFFVLALAACKEKHEGVRSFTKISFDTLHISLRGGNYMPDPVISHSDDLLFAFDHYFKERVYVYDVENKKAVKEIVFQIKDSPEFDFDIQRIGRFENFIVASSRKKVFLFDFEGILQHVYPIPVGADGVMVNPGPFPHSMGDKPFLLFSTRRSGRDWMGNYDWLQSDSLFVQFDLISRKFSRFKVPLPADLVKDNVGYYSSLAPLYSIKGDTLVYSFSFSGDFYFYHLESGAFHHQPISSTVIPKGPDPITLAEYKDPTFFLKSIKSTLSFGTVVFSKAHNVYFRTLVRSDEDAGVKEKFLMVISPEFEVLNEFPIPQEFFPKIYTLPSGIAFRKVLPDSESNFTLYKVKLE